MLAGFYRPENKKLQKFHNVSGKTNACLNSPFFLLMMFVGFMANEEEEDNPDKRNQGAEANPEIGFGLGIHAGKQEAGAESQEDDNKVVNQ